MITKPRKEWTEELKALNGKPMSRVDFFNRYEEYKELKDPRHPNRPPAVIPQHVGEARAYQAWLAGEMDSAEEAEFFQHSVLTAHGLVLHAITPTVRELVMRVTMLEGGVHEIAHDVTELKKPKRKKGEALSDDVEN